MSTIEQAACAVVASAPLQWTAIATAATGAVAVGWSWSSGARKARDWTQRRWFSGALIASMLAVIALEYANLLWRCGGAPHTTMAAAMAGGALMLYCGFAVAEDLAGRKAR